MDMLEDRKERENHSVNIKQQQNAEVSDVGLIA